MKPFLILVIALAIAASNVLAPTSARADGHEIVLVEQRAESDFPNGIRFFIEATSPDEIDDIRVFFKKLGQTSRSTYRKVEFEPGAKIQGETLVISGSGGEYIPPGTRIEYAFEIRDTAGRELRTPEVVFVYLDNRFEWQTLSAGVITLYYNDVGLADRAQEMLDAAQQTLERMSPVLGIEPKHPLHIVTYGDYWGEMVDALPFRAQAVRDNLITLGTAFTEERVLLVLNSESSYLDTTSHEFIHLLVADAAGRANARVPAWLNEGLAEYGNIVETNEYEGFLSQAIAKGELRPLWHQNTFSGTPRDILVAYGQGESVVRFLASTYGEEKIADLIRALKKTFDIDAALMDTYGIDQYGLDSAWRKDRGLDPLPPPENRVTQQQPTATPTSTAPPDPVATPTSAPEVIAQPTSPPQAEENAGDSGSFGCSAPVPGGPVVIDLAFLMLLVAPLAMLSVGRFRRR